MITFGSRIWSVGDPSRRVWELVTRHRQVLKDRNPSPPSTEPAQFWQLSPPGFAGWWPFSAGLWCLGLGVSAGFWGMGLVAAEFWGMGLVAKGFCRHEIESHRVKRHCWVVSISLWLFVAGLYATVCNSTLIGCKRSWPVNDGSNLSDHDSPRHGCEYSVVTAVADHDW